MGAKRNAFRDWVGKTCGKENTEKQGINRECHKMNLKEIWWWGVDCIHVAHNRESDGL